MPPSTYILVVSDNGPWRVGCGSSSGISRPRPPAPAPAPPRLVPDQASTTMGAPSSPPTVPMAWQEIEPNPPQTDSQGELGSRVHAALRQLGYQGKGLLLAIPSSWCLSASVSTQGLPRRQWRQPLVYRLEEKLPLAAEEFVADFLLRANEGIGVACRIDRVQPLVNALETLGIAVDVITPATFLAVQHLLGPPNCQVSEVEPPSVGDTATPQSAPFDPSAVDAVLWCDGDMADFMALLEQKAAAWSHMPADAADVLMRVRLLAQGRDSPLRVAVRGANDQLREALDQESCLTLVSLEPLRLHEACLQAASEVLSGQSSAWIDFARGGLIGHDPMRRLRKSLTQALTAAVVFLAVTCIGLVWRSTRYDHLIGQYQASQQAIFRQTFPGQSVPVGVRSRLESEERRARGLSGDASELSGHTSGLVVLRDLLGRFPGEIRFRLMELRIENDRVYLEGQARSHGDADAIATALRRQQGFSMEPPRTENLAEKGVSFTLNGSPPPPAEANRGEPVGAAASPSENPTLPTGLAHRSSP